MMKGIYKLCIKMVIGVLFGEESKKKHWQKGEPVFLIINDFPLNLDKFF